MKYFEAPQDYTRDQGFKVFLAGGIGNCPDWQATARAMFSDTDITVLNPRRPSFRTPWTREDSREQITWEFKALEAADVVLFWFPASASAQPIALYELGSWARQKTKPIVVGRAPGYLRADDIDIQLELLRPELAVYTSLGAVCDAVEQYAGFQRRGFGWA